MASFAILNRERHGEMADPAKFAADDVVHAEMLGPFFLNIKDIGMAVGTVEPFSMFLVGKDSPGRNAAPFRFQTQVLIEGYRLKVCI